MNFCIKYIKTKAKIVKHKSIWKFALSGEPAIKMMELLWGNSIIHLDRKKKKIEEVKHEFEFNYKNGSS